MVNAAGFPGLRIHPMPIPTPIDLKPEVAVSTIPVDERVQAKASSVMREVKSHDSDSDSDDSVSSTKKMSTGSDSENEVTRSVKEDEFGLDQLFIEKRERTEVEIVREALKPFAKELEGKEGYSLECFVLERILHHALLSSAYELKDGTFQISKDNFQKFVTKLTPFFTEMSIRLKNQESDIIAKSGMDRFIKNYSILLNSNLLQLSIAELTNKQKDTNQKNTFKCAFNLIKEMTNLTFNILATPYFADTEEELEAIVFYKDLTTKFHNIQDKIDKIFGNINSIISNPNYSKHSLQEPLNQMKEVIEEFVKNVLKKFPDAYNVKIVKCKINFEINNKAFLLRDTIRAFALFLDKRANLLKDNSLLKESSVLQESGFRYT